MAVRLVLSCSLIVAVLLALIASPAAHAGSVAAAEGYSYVLSPSQLALTPGGGQMLDDATLLMWSNATASATVTFGEAHEYHSFLVRARADQCDGPPAFEVWIDGALISTALVTVSQQGDGLYAGSGSWGSGHHEIEVRYINDVRTATCDRNLKLGEVNFYPGPVTPWVNLDLNDMTRDGATTGTFPFGASSDTAIGMWRDTTVSTNVWAQSISRVHVLVGRDWCPGTPIPHLVVRLNGDLIGDREASPTTGASRFWLDFPADVSAVGFNALELSFANSTYTSACDTNLKLYQVQLEGTST